MASAAMLPSGRKMTPRLVYDGECGFCRYTVDYAHAITGDDVEYVPYQDVADQYPDHGAEDFAASIWLFAPGSAASGADAAFRTLAIGGRKTWLRAYRRVPGFAVIAEFLYRCVSRHRVLCLRIARWLFGRELKPARFELTAEVVYRGVMAMALVAFASLWLQAEALIGDNGVLPAREYLDAVYATFGAGGYWRVPTVLWFGISPHWVLGAGALCATVGLVGRFKTTAALGAYAAYLSLLGVGQTFTGYQWDTFLVECLFAIAILARSPVAGIWVLRLLAFRFMFLSGAVKLLSGDPVWADLSALEYHFETQPLPNALAWFAHQLPAPALKFAVAATFTIELVLPFLIFAPRKMRAVAALAFVFLEVLIFATGNYNFFNLLTIVVCIALLDDRFLRRDGSAPRPHFSAQRLGARWLAGAVIALGVCQTATAFVHFPNPARWVDPLRVVNRYGLFAVMTTERRELVIEGSMDGDTWLEYEFPFKPGDVDRIPGWATPHQPRLDWQMWFAALTVPQRAPWIHDLVFRLFEAEPAVLRWIESPFGDDPPKYIRIISYRYRFTGADASRDHVDVGRWWTRSNPRIWLGPIARRVPTVTHEPLVLDQ
ncbi:MAG: lipase maturation factor family protein [Gammaproteobacteria bacterium]|nr:lipase maturation factor family protein [Gammaproteobacteria bacterium]